MAGLRLGYHNHAIGSLKEDGKTLQYDLIMEVCDPELVKMQAQFLAIAKERGKPIFHNVNLSDPHRVFIGAQGPDDLAFGTAPSRWIKPEEIRAPVNRT